MIKLKDVVKTFNFGRHNQFTALKGICLDISLNRITVIKGPSGSGKTTLCSVIGCMTRPTSGRITINEREITSLPERFLSDIRRKNFGFIFQKFNLMNGITVLENILLPTYPVADRNDKQRDKALALLEKLNIESKANQKVENLSSGEQQRAAIARALINDPKIIIADEPTAHLDTDTAMQFLDIAEQLHAENKTLLITSHDPLVYDSDIVHRIVELKNGLIADGGE